MKRSIIYLSVLAQSDDLDMAKEKLSVTQAVRALRAAGVEFTDHPYTYEEHGDTEVCARELNVEPVEKPLKGLILTL